MEERINDLELRYMRQEKTIQELNQIVSRQDLIIELMRREIKAMREESLLSAPLMEKDAEQEKPPHY